MSEQRDSDRRPFDARRFLLFGIAVGVLWSVAVGTWAVLADAGVMWAVAAWGLVVAGWSAVRLRVVTLPDREM